MHKPKIKHRRAILSVAVAVAVLVFCLHRVERPPDFHQRTGHPQLISVQDVQMDPEWCPPPARSLPEDSNLFAAFGETSVYAGSQASGEPGVITRPPIRTIRDKDPIYSAIAVDTRFDEVILMDNNNWGLRIFNRLDNTPANAPFTQPKRIIEGPETDIQFNNGLYIDPQNGDIYSVETDTGDKVVVFPRDAKGNMKPARILATPHRGFALAVDEEKGELFVGVQYPPEVAVYRKGASGSDKPLRSLQGESTRLSDVHGIAIDPKNKLLYVTNWGHISDYRTPGTGRFEDPSISVYPLGADGDTSPLRSIKGPKTQMDWPAQMTIDPDTGDLYVANDMGHSVLVFKGTDQGDVAPARVIKGNRTGLANPSGVFVDKKNRELWVSNFGNSSAVVYPLNADGNVAPVRTIRSAPANKVSLKFGKVEALAYDERRDQIWVPN
jgi:6-phosphogluconolactonase (cycloisomerase 2 family)